MFRLPQTEDLKQNYSKAVDVYFLRVALESRVGGLNLGGHIAWRADVFG